MKRAFGIVLVIVLVRVGVGFCAEPGKIQRLMKALQSTEYHERRVAMYELRRLGLDAAPATAQLIQALDDPEREIRALAADTLENIGEEASPAIPKLIDRLGEDKLQRIVTDAPTINVGFSAACALGEMGSEAVGPLARCLEHKNPAVRIRAAYALGWIGPEAKVATAALIKLLEDEEEMARMAAIRAIAQIGPEAKKPEAKNPEDKNVIPAILKKLDDENHGVRVAAVDALGSIKPTTRLAVDGLIKALHDKEGLVQAHAANALGNLGDKAISAVPALCETLKSRGGYPYPDGHPYFWRPIALTAARALGRIGPAAKEAVPKLLETLGNKEATLNPYGQPTSNCSVRAEAAKAVARIAPNDKAVIRALSESFDTDHRIEVDVALALSIAGKNAKGAIPLLVGLLEDEERLENENSHYPLETAIAILNIKPGHPVAMRTFLEELAANPPIEEEIWDEVIRVLAKAGRDGRKAIPILVEIIQQEPFPDPARALAQFGPDAAEAVPTLIDTFDNWDEEVGQEVIAALQRITSGKSPLLTAALKQREPEIQCGIIKVLGRFPSAVPQLAEATNDPSARVRLAAVTALGKLGRAAEPAVPHIRKLLQDDYRTIREAAQRTLESVQSASP
jgi:HEAT repeat protein